MDLLHLSISLPSSAKLTSFGRRSFSKDWRTHRPSQSCSYSGNTGKSICKDIYGTGGFNFSRKKVSGLKLRSNISKLPRSTGSSSPNDNSENQGDSSDKSKIPFGYTRKDVMLIGLGVTAFGVGLKYALEYFGVDPLKAGNVVQLVVVLGVTVGWISTYLFRVSNKDMTYAKQLRDYESKVMEKRLESLSEVELEVLLEQVEEEKVRLARRRKMRETGLQQKP